jgi:hypothetical protein
MNKYWFQQTARRMLFDMHIPDWDERFLSKFDPEELAKNVADAQVSTLTIPANTHTGLCYWPTKVGAEHQAVKGKDLLGQNIACAHNHGLNVVIYYCTIYCDWYWEQHPEARVMNGEGKSEKLLMNSYGHPRRFSVSCMNNSGYRQFVVDQLREICETYDFEGVWPDMTFWPTVCYCPSCQQRYRAETGCEIPRTIDWTNPDWVRFQSKRQEWVRDFCHLVTATIRRDKPSATVAHQSQTFNGDWLFGASTQLAEESDFLSADLYGDRLTLSYSSKLFASLSKNLPFEHLNSWTYPAIHEHVIPRSEAHLEINAFAALMNHGAFGFVGFPDPDGSIHRDYFRRGGKVFQKLALYEAYQGGTFCQDVAIYHSFEALFDLEENGKPAIAARYNFEPGRPISGPNAHRNTAISAANVLLDQHIPFGVITRKNLHDLSRYQAVILSNVALMDDEEVNAIRAYVANGGNLYASKCSSLINGRGERLADFQLGDLFGVSYSGETEELLTYMTPVEETLDLFDPYTVQSPAPLLDRPLRVKAHSGAQVLATLTLPWTDPQGTPYASILTDPPGKWTGEPFVVLNRYGKGRVIYAAGVPEIWEHESLVQVIGRFFHLLLQRQAFFKTDAPRQVELTLFEQADQRRLILHLLNNPAELPPLPIYNIRVSVQAGDHCIQRVMILPEREPVPFDQEDGWLTFPVEKLIIYRMISIEW